MTFALSPASIPGSTVPRGLRATLVGSLLLHCAALALLSTVWQGVEDGGKAPRLPLVVRLIEAVRPTLTERASPPEPIAPARATVRRTIADPRSQIIGSHEAAAAPVAPATEPPPGPASPAPHPRGIDPDSIARASREAARARSLAGQSNELLGRRAPPSAQQKLVAEVARAAKADCLKGGPDGYDRQHYGLLAIPLLVYDAATGQCRD